MSLSCAGQELEAELNYCASSEEAAAMMNTMFDKNPIGVEFDPDDWLVRLRAGQAESSFLPRQSRNLEFDTRNQPMTPNPLPVASPFAPYAVEVVRQWRLQ